MPSQPKSTDAGATPGTSYIDSAAVDWQPAGDKYWTKLLREDPVRGEKTLLMKLDAGASFQLHAHDEVEQIFVISGSFFDQNRVLHAGDYACRAPGALHTAGSDKGAVMLLIYSPA
jgi:anti-sigma factor ChrR (cupin superfamily)